MSVKILITILLLSCQSDIRSGIVIDKISGNSTHSSYNYNLKGVSTYYYSTLENYIIIDAITIGGFKEIRSYNVSLDEYYHSFNIGDTLSKEQLKKLN